MKHSARAGLCLAARFTLAVGASFLLGLAHASANSAADDNGASDPKPAQQTPALAATGDTAQALPISTTLQGVVVTGTLIRQPSLTSDAALDSLNSKELQLEGTVNVNDLLDQMPQVTAGLSSTSNSNANESTGVAQIDLRGLGPSRTLVLIDGNRVVPGDPSAGGGPQADLNFIPAALVERVDVLSGGASTVYGSDAVAGVVNFIMNKDVQGFKLDAQAGATAQGDGANYTTTAIWGTSFADGGGHIELYAGYTRFNAVTQGERSFSSQTYDRTCTSAEKNANGSCQEFNEFFDVGTPAQPATAVNDTTTGAQLMVNPTGQGLQNTFVPQAALYNQAPPNFLQRPDKRYQLGGFANRKFNEHEDVYGSVMFMEDNTVVQAAPASTFASRSIAIGCDDAPPAGSTAVDPLYNPLLSDQERDVLCGPEGARPATTTVTVNHRFLDLGPRDQSVQHDDYRIQFGVRGAIDRAWDYDVSYQRGESNETQYLPNVLFAPNYAQAIANARAPASNPSDTNPADAVCAAGSAAGCAPLNVFQFDPQTQLSPVSPAALSFITTSSSAQGSTTQEVGRADFTGDLGQYHLRSPFAQRGVQVAVGAQDRRETLDVRPDGETSSGNLSGALTFLPVSGSVDVRELYSEVQLPVAQEEPFVKDFSLDTAFRSSKYSTATGTVNAFKGAFRYQPTEDVMLRASWNRAVRAPDITELFAPVTQGRFADVDPCAGAAPTASLATCEKMGVTPAEFGKIPLCQGSLCFSLIGGNPDLQAERAITRELGLVFTPRFLKGFSGSVDFYEIVIGNAIGTVPPSATLAGCVAGNSAFCGNVIRGAGGVLFGPPGIGVEATNINIGNIETSGFDFKLNYDRYSSDLGLPDLGRIDINFYGTLLTSYDIEDVPGVFPRVDCTGLYGQFCSELNGGQPNPRWRHSLRFTWVSPDGWVTRDLGMSLLWRYLSPVQLDQNVKSSDPEVGGKVFDALDDIPSKSYVDLTLFYHLPLPNESVTVSFGVDNLTNDAPPILAQSVLPSADSANTIPGTYDVLGRRFFLGFDMNFL